MHRCIVRTEQQARPYPALAAAPRVRAGLVTPAHGEQLQGDAGQEVGHVQVQQDVVAVRLHTAAPACSQPVEEPAGKQLTSGQLQLVQNQPILSLAPPTSSASLTCTPCILRADFCCHTAFQHQGLGKWAVYAFGTSTEEQPRMSPFAQHSTSLCSLTCSTARCRLASLKSASSEHSAVQQMVYPTCESPARQPDHTGEQGHAGAARSMQHRNEEEGERCSTVPPQIHGPSPAYSTSYAMTTVRTSIYIL